MASNMMPIPVPPRTPTPPPDDEHFRTSSVLDPAQGSFNPNALSPSDENMAMRYNTMPSVQEGRLSPILPLSATTNSLMGDNASDERNPFNFQTTTYTVPNSPGLKSNVGQRRGHKYKHSSVSYQIFQEPPSRPPLALPASLPIPTFKECRKSLSNEQRNRISWCGCHAGVAAFTLWSAHGSLALTALSHLILFDALGATLCVVVDILGNFEVWKRSSIRHPFGLERAEVLAGFAMSVFLLFMGLDLISHNLQHVLEGLGTHEPHHKHKHLRVSPGSIDMASLLAIVSTLVSAIGLKNHARIGKAMRFAYMESLPSILSNPSHFLTLSCSALLLVLPLLSIQMYVWLDRLLSATVALSMCFLGIRLVKTLGLMLLMSYNGPASVAGVMKEIEADPVIATIEEAKFWQVHYGLCMANLKLRVRRGTGEDALVSLRERVGSLIRNRLGGGYGMGRQRWEVSTQMTIDNA
ncbi:MAG: Endoplasmic reticulum zinc transporter [Vezdaea aestivalis]|nr:MAG: Endoplasmic reticulum zinc transporter [Vezdaea aestivalis]